MALSKSEAFDLVNELKELGVNETHVTIHDFVSEDNTVGQLYRVHAAIRDQKSGNSIVRNIGENVIASDVVAGMRKEMKDRAKAASARMRTERSVNRS